MPHDDANFGENLLQGLKPESEGCFYAGAEAPAS